MRNMRVFRSTIMSASSVLLVLFLLTGCSLRGYDTPPGEAAGTSANQTAESRGSLVNTNKTKEYFSSIVDDPTALAAFVNQMPKGADVRRAFPMMVAPSAATDGIPFPEDDYRVLIQKAMVEHVGYLEVVANVTPAQIEQLDAIQARAKQEYEDKGLAFDVTVSFLAAVDGTLATEEFSEEMLAAFELDAASDRVVGVTVYPAIEDENTAVFLDKMKAIDLVYETFTASQEIEPASTEVETTDAETTNAETTDAETTEDETTQDNATEAEVISAELAPAVNISIAIGGAQNEWTNFGEMNDRISMALEIGHVSRIDYGATVAREPEVYTLLKDMKEKNITVTFVPVADPYAANPQTSDVSTFTFFASADIDTAVVSTAANGEVIDLSAAYAQLIRAHDLSYDEVKTLVYSSLDVAFLSNEAREAEITRLSEAFAAFEKTLAESL